ncbi:hypothetical protein AAE250_01945 [Bacteroides sp. GD17]|uniref:hypothetical protein n=1 Tax=Bacteroides sp. GD17 TaxID=3139826 RepID=UPI0025D07D9F|nr:hypothetical protein [uncultured Bacteroides sp.]
MKRYIYTLFTVLIATVTFTSCSDDEGTNPGNDSAPAVTLYQYTASRPNNPDNDIILRLATNNKTTEVYYLAEKTSEKEAHVASMGESGYMDYVVSNGKKVDGLSAASTADVTVVDLYGAYTITAVAVGGNKKTSAETTYTGLEWTDVVTGTYYYGASPKLIEALGLTSSPTTLQLCTTDATLYRFKDVFGPGYSLKIKLIDYTGSDDDGKYQFFRVPATDTPFVYGSHGTVNVRDIGYWQGNDAFVTEGGYESGMYGNYNCFIYIQYYVAVGGIDYGYDSFIAD